MIREFVALLIPGTCNVPLFIVPRPGNEALAGFAISSALFYCDIAILGPLKSILGTNLNELALFTGPRVRRLQFALVHGMRVTVTSRPFYWNQ